MKNLKESLLEKGNLNCDCKVSTKLVGEMEIFGFVPYSHESISIIPPLGQVIACSDRIILSINESNIRIPIYQTIARCDEEMLLAENLYIPSLFFSENKYVQQWFKDYFKRRNDSTLRKISNQVHDVVEVEGRWYYKMNPQNWLFISESPIRAVADDFLVVCRRINNVTGVIVYETYRPEDLVITLTKENLSLLEI